MHIGAAIWIVYFGWKYVKDNYFKNSHIGKQNGKLNIDI